MKIAPENERAPRTLVGLTRDGRLLLVTVGQGELTVPRPGASIDECAAIMHRLGAVQAFNFDGGASTQMIVPGDPALSVPGDRAVKGYVGVFKR